MPAVDSALHVPHRAAIPAHLRYERCGLRMMRSLLAELLHEEESNLRRAARDANRYDGVELGSPFRAVATHAGATIPRLDELARERGLRRRRASRLVRRLMDRAHDLCHDRFVSAERAYRVTISRIRHGIDLVRMVRSAAEGADDVELARFCDEWIGLRVELVDALTGQIEWFADRPRVSMETAHSIANARRQMQCSRHLASQCAALPRIEAHGRLTAPWFVAADATAPNLQ